MNKFLTTNDERLDKMDDFVVPVEWWSRPFEYAFASKFLNEKDIVVDAGCGIEHPFKWYAAKRCKKVYCVDMDTNAGNNYYENMVFLNQFLTEMNIPEKVDTIFCISVIEHLPSVHISIVLEKMYKSLKNKGKIVLTVDYPTIGYDILLYHAEQLGLKVVNHDYDPNHTENIYNDLYYLKCFTLVMEKDVKEVKEEVKENVKKRLSKETKKVSDIIE